MVAALILIARGPSSAGGGEGIRRRIVLVRESWLQLVSSYLGVGMVFLCLIWGFQCWESDGYGLLLLVLLNPITRLLLFLICCLVGISKLTLGSDVKLQFLCTLYLPPVLYWLSYALHRCIKNLMIFGAIRVVLGWPLKFSGATKWKIHRWI